MPTGRSGFREHTPTGGFLLLLVITQAMRNVVSKKRFNVIVDVILLLTILIVCRTIVNPFPKDGGSKVN